MAKEIYPFAYIVQGNFAGQYVYYQGYDDNYYVRPESVYKDGLFSNGLWYKASYQYKLRSIIGYEEIGSATQTADAASIIKGGLMLGVVGAMAVSAAGARTTYDTMIYFNDGKQCVFRFLNSTVHQNHITSFYQLNVMQGNPNANQSAQPLLENNAMSDKLPSVFIVDAEEIDMEGLYDIYCLGYKENKNTTFSSMTTKFLKEHNLWREEDGDIDSLYGKVLATNSIGTIAWMCLKMEYLTVNFGIVKAGEPNPFEEVIEEDDNKATTNDLDYIEELKQLKELVNLGVINQEEFDIKKKQLLGL